MTKRTFIAAIALIGSLAACKREAPEPEPTDVAEPAPAAVPSIIPSAAPSAAPAPTRAATRSAPRLDIGALSERKDPDRLLRFYVSAVQSRQWALAARAWGAESGVTGAMLKSAYDRPAAPRFELGKGTVEGAAGSLYYEAPVVLRFGGANAAPERGTLVLRRVNDVDGATPEQLRWHIEKSTIGMGQ